MSTSKLDKAYGHTEPRLYTPPKRALDAHTSLGPAVTAFARDILGVTLYPWQEWLLLHMLELNDDGTLRYRRVIVLVARQNGKSMLAYVLAAYWTFVDSMREPDVVAPQDYLVVGTAQNLDIAMQPWRRLARACDPTPSVSAETSSIPVLQDMTDRVRTVNGDAAIITKLGSRYEVRAANSSRGKPASKVLLDELREQRTWDAWNALAPTTKSFRNGMLLGISNAGDARSVVLQSLRDAAIRSLDGTGDDTLALFEWSAPDDCAKDDDEAILAANPSIGWGSMTVQTVKADIPTMTDAAYRTEDLCQWVTAKTDTYLDVDDWDACAAGALSIHPAVGAPLVWSVDTSSDRSYTWVACATRTVDGRAAVQVVHRQPGMLWTLDWLASAAKLTGHTYVAYQAKGCPAAEYGGRLERMGLDPLPIQGTDLSNVAGHFRDAVREGRVVHPRQPAVDMTVGGNMAKRMSECDAWDRHGSVTDISGLVAESEALYALDLLVDAAEAPPKKYTPTATMPFMV